MKQFSCGDVVPGCRMVVSGADEPEVLDAVARHARDDHGMAQLPPDLVEQVRGHIHDTGGTMM